VGGVPVGRRTPNTRRPRHVGRSRRRRGLRLGGSATRRSFLTRNDAQRAVHRRDDRRPAVIPAHLIPGRRPANDGLDGAGSPRGVQALCLRLDAISYGCVHLSRPSSCPDKRERPPVEYRGSPKADWRARRAPSGPSKSRSGRAKRARSGRLHRLRGSYHTSRSAEHPSYGRASDGRCMATPRWAEHWTGSGRMGDHPLVSKSERRVTPIGVMPPHPRLAMITWARGRPGRRLRLRRWLWEEQYATYLGHCGLSARTRSRRSRRAAGNAEAPSHPKEVAS